MVLSPLHKKALTDTGLFLFGFLIVYPLSFRSLMALDQGIIFEGGARIAQGQLPFRDFYLPFGIIPCYIQAALFKIFGISWKVYALHACIINGFAAIIIYRLFQILTPYSLGFRLFITIFSTCFFYTIPATPYADNHAMFFSLLAIYSWVLAQYKSPKYIFITPISLILAFLSKQNPTSFYLVLFLILGLANSRFFKANFSIFIKSIALTATICIVLLLFWPWESFLQYYIQLPSSLGSIRMSKFSFNRFKDFYRLSQDGAKYLIWLLPICIVLLATKKNKERKWNRFFIGLGIFIISIMAAFSTMNQQQNAYTFITLSVFIFLSPLYEFLATKKKVYGIMFGIVISIFSMGGIVKKVNFVVHREFNDITYNYRNERSTYHENLGLYHQEFCPMGTIADYDTVINFLKSSGENFVWFGDASFIGSMIGNESVMPLIFYHPGLTYPNPEKDPQKFEELKKNIFRKMANKNTKYLMIESEKTFMGATLHQFWLELLPYGKVVLRSVSSKIYEIDPQFYNDVVFRKQ